MRGITERNTGGGFGRAAPSAQSLPVRPQGAGVPRPGALNPQSGQVGPGVAKPPGRSLTTVGSRVHGLHTSIIFCVLDVVGLPWLMLWGGLLNWPGDKEGPGGPVGGGGRACAP